MNDQAAMAYCALPKEALQYLQSILPNGFIILYEVPLPSNEEGGAVLMANFTRPNTAVGTIGNVVASILNSHR